MRWFARREAESVPSDQLQQTQLKRIAEYKPFILLRVSRCGCKRSIYQMDQVYSITEAPPLPLPGCTSPECRCVYEGVVDRRAKKARRYRIERRCSVRQDSDRRTNHGRRKGDLLMSYQHY